MTAPDLVRAWIGAHDLSQADFARLLKVTPTTVHDWLTGAKRPTTPFRAAIAKVTSEAVPVDAWSSDEDRAIVERVRPFAPAPVAEKPAAEGA